MKDKVDDIFSKIVDFFTSSELERTINEELSQHKIEPNFLKSFTENFIGWKLDNNNKLNTNTDELNQMRQEMIVQANTFKECLRVVFCIEFN